MSGDPTSTTVGESILLRFKDSWSTIEDESLTILQKLLRTDTQSFDEDGSETVAAKYIKEIAGIECSEILEGWPGRGNLVARIRGDGSSGLGTCFTECPPGYRSCS